MDLDELLAQKAALDERIAEIKQAERADAISQALALIRHYELTERDLFKGAKAAEPVKAKAAVEPKYLNPVTGQTWSGRGRAPAWLNGDRAAFAI